MKISKSEIAIIGIILIFFVVAGYFYPQMPERMASHWNASGQADVYTSKFWGLFLMPFISIGLSLLLVLIPRIDPLKANIEKFKKYYYNFVILMVLFFFYVYLLTIFWNLGIRFNMTQLLSPAIGVLFYFCGILVEKAKRNYFIGIRTPWTLSNENVWNKTHLIGGKLFKASGVIAVLGAFFPDYAILFMLIPVILLTFFTIIYSYWEYQRETRLQR